MFVCLVHCGLRVCVCAFVSYTLPVNVLYYQTIKPEKTLSTNAPPRKTFSFVTWPRIVCCMPRLSTPSSPSGSFEGRGHMTPDRSFGATSTKRLSVLQAVAQGYCPITQEDTEQETYKGNQSA